MDAMVARAKPGVKEYELRAAAGAAILEGGGDIDFLIIGSTPMANPAMIFGNPRPSARVLTEGRHHQHGARRRLSRLHRADRLADLRRRADRDGAQILGRDHAARLSHASSPRSRRASRSKNMRAGQQVLPRQRLSVAADAVPRHRSRHRQAARRRRARRGGRIRAGAQARHGDHGRAQSDHARTACSAFSSATPSSSPRPATKWSTSSRWRSRWRAADLPLPAQRGEGSTTLHLKNPKSQPSSAPRICSANSLA